MSAYVLLKLLNELGKKIWCEAKPRSISPNEFDKFNNTGARMQDYFLSYGAKIAFN